jgi:hypothetical protein
MARTNSNTHSDGTLRSTDVSNQTVSQVGKAALEVLKLHRSLDENMTTVQTDDERQRLTEQTESAAVRAISEQGITVAEYNEVLTAAQADPELEERLLSVCRLA